MKISIIIPTLNEAENISELISYLLKNGNESLSELLVVDGGSNDGTCRIARDAGAKVIICPSKGRSCQMNEGVKNSTGDILYFVHADTTPPASFMTDIKEAVNEGFPMGCYRFKFDSNKKILKFNAYMTRFDKLYCRGGDQTLFVTRDVFEELDGYRYDFKIMEEYDFMVRARKKYSFKIIPKEVIVSARKYEKRSWFRVMLANSIVFQMFKYGASQDALAKTYQRLLG
ncbi:MAG: TIGR04283 family arsenosugar biosynthesis glycosyltransferase [Saprospiraceae bacterium]